MSHDHFFSTPQSAGTHLRIDGVSFSYPDRRVLTDISFTVTAGDNVGLIGENGSGKSTLLQLIAGRLEPTAGTLQVNTPGSHSPTVGLLHQEPPFSSDASIADAIEDAVVARRLAVQSVSDLGAALADDPDNPEVADAYAAALDAADRLGAWDVDARISEMLTRLGLGNIDQTRHTGSLSGGQRARLALGWLLLNAPDVLLLDEPTNHLDDAAVDYVASVLRSWRGPVLMASHDRAFLDDTVTSLIDLDPSMMPHSVTRSLLEDGKGTGIGITRFTGTYSAYIADRAEARRRWERLFRDEQAELSQLRAAVKEQQVVGHVDWKPRTEVRGAQKFYADRNAKVVARRVNDARARLQELEERQIRKPPAALTFRGLNTTDEVSRTTDEEPVLVATNITVVHRLESVSLSVSRGEKWLITGLNGSGKSTLLGVLAGTLRPSSGQVWHTRPSQDRSARARLCTG